MKLVCPNLEQTYKDLQDQNKREAAEIAYALGVMCKRVGDVDGMRRYREDSIRLFRELTVDTLDGAIPVYETINDVLMPSLIHEGVVARDLSETISRCI